MSVCLSIFRNWSVLNWLFVWVSTAHVRLRCVLGLVSQILDFRSLLQHPPMQPTTTYYLRCCILCHPYTATVILSFRPSVRLSDCWLLPISYLLTLLCVGYCLLLSLLADLIVNHVEDDNLKPKRSRKRCRRRILLGLQFGSFSLELGTMAAGLATLDKHNFPVAFFRWRCFGVIFFS